MTEQPKRRRQNNYRRVQHPAQKWKPRGGIGLGAFFLRCAELPNRSQFQEKATARKASWLHERIFRLTYSYMGMYIAAVPRAATTSDAFNAVAEPRRREILNYLAMQERPVGEIVAALGLEQPSVSKHLRVLRDVGLVRVRREGRNMLYSLDAEAIRPMYEWTQTFERFWKHQLQRVKERAEERAAAAKGPREDPEKAE
jgi:DNA-binding transcriptional ArsR family regulator